MRRFRPYAVFFAGIFLVGCYPDQPPPTGISEDQEIIDRSLLPASSFRIVAGDSTYARFHWRDESIREDGYVLEMSENGGPFAAVDSAGPNSDSLTHFRQFDEAIRYSFRLKAVRNGYSGGPTPTVTYKYQEEIFFLKYHVIGGVLYDGVFRLSNGTVSLSLSSTLPNFHQYNDLAFHGDSLVLIGSFTDISGLPALRAAAWDGMSWSRLGEGIEHVGPFRLISSPTGLYVGTSYSRFSSSSIYRWRGDRFHPLTMPGLFNAGVIIGGTYYDGLTIFAFDLARINDSFRTPLAVLAYREHDPATIAQPTAPLLDHYRQTSIVAHTDGVYLSLARTQNPDGHAVDTTLIRYDGTSWSVMNVTPPGTVLNSLVSYDGHLFGIRIDLDTLGRSLGSAIVIWDGNSWQPFHHEAWSYEGLWSTPHGLITSAGASLYRWRHGVWESMGTLPGGQLPRKIAAKPAWTWIHN